MPKFEIKKTIYCNLVVDCKNELEAQVWASNIIASLENEMGEVIDSDKFESFDAETIVSESAINLIE